MLFSRMVERPIRLKTAMANTAIGIEADTVKPARMARYTVAAPKMMPKITPKTMALIVNSGMTSDAGTNGSNFFWVSSAIEPPECEEFEPQQSRAGLAASPRANRMCLRNWLWLMVPAYD